MMMIMTIAMMMTVRVNDDEIAEKIAPCHLEWVSVNTVLCQGTGTSKDRCLLPILTFSVFFFFLVKILIFSWAIPIEGNVYNIRLSICSPQKS